MLLFLIFHGDPGRPCITRVWDNLNPIILNYSYLVILVNNLGKRSYLPEGNTPGKTKTKLDKQEKKKGPRKSLFPEDTNAERKGCNPNSIAYGNWTNSEIKALVQHICLFWDSAHLDKWPTIKNMKFWNECASSVNQMCKSSRTRKCFNFLEKYKA